MPLFHITESLPGRLSGPGGTGDPSSPIGRIEDVDYTLFIAGIGFLAAKSDRYPYERRTRPIRKEQLDITSSPGEQSLSGDWWYRSQQTFHGGAGIEFLDPAQDNGGNLIRFKDSFGVDVWTKGRLSLLRATTTVTSPGVAGLVAGYDDAGTPGLFHCYGSTAVRNDGSSESSVTWGGTGDILALTDDGTDAYVADNVGIYRVGLASGTGTLLWNTGSDSVALGFVKQRLVAGIGPSLYELVSGGPGLPSIPLYTHPNASWTWSAVSEGPGAVYAAGYAGSRSAIFKFTLDEDGGMPVLSSGVVVAELPAGEVVHSLLTYLGSYMGIGTNLGLRVAYLDRTGDIQYGPLIFETDHPVRAMTAKDRFLFVGVEGGQQGFSGLVRVDLAEEVEPGRFAYANDLVATDEGVVGGVTLFGNTGRVAFATTNLNLEHATDLVSAGLLNTGQIRFSTLENKQFLSMRLRGDVTQGGVVVSSTQVDGDVVTLVSYGTGSDLGQVATVTPSSPQESLAFQLLLTRDVSDATAGPELLGYQTRAAPAPTSTGEEIRIPVLMFDFIKDRNGVKHGYEGYAFEQYAAVMNLYPGIVSVQDTGSGERMLCYLEAVEFAQTSPSKQTSGFGGICYFTLRTIVD